MFGFRMIKPFSNNNNIFIMKYIIITGFVIYKFSKKKDDNIKYDNDYVYSIINI